MVLDILVGMKAKEGATLVLVTHDPAVAGLADRRIHLLDGRIDREEAA
jgi:predicted ABC-type transport system involved in lysophospholipase L1 biosynthesis ATPase subunit